MMYPGGQALNFSVYTKMLGFNSAFLGVFGNDAIANHNINVLKELSIDISHCRFYDGENGYAVVDLIDGERVFITSNKGGILKSNPINLSQEDLNYLSNFDIIHTSNNSYMDSQLETLASLGSVLSYDFSTAWKDDLQTANICKHINFGFMSCAELSVQEVKNQMESAHTMGTDIVVATRGSKNTFVYNGERFFTSSPREIQAVDTLGAGDSFIATFITSFVQNIWHHEELHEKEYVKRMNDCLEIANDMAAKTCMMMGAFGYGTKLV